MKLRSILIFIAFSCSLQAQDPAIYYKKLAQNLSDTSNINAYNALTQFYIYDNNDSANYYCQRSLILSIEKRKENFNYKGNYWRGELERLSKNYNEALKYSRLAQQIAKQNNSIADEVEALILTGSIFESAMLGKSAIENYKNAFELSKENKYKAGIISSGTSLGLYFKDDNEFTGALNYLLEAYPVAKEIKDTLAIFRCAINLGTIYERTNDREKALRFYREALSINSADNDQNGMAICYFKIGRLFANLNEHDSAKVYLEKTMKIHLERKDELGLIFDYSFLASLYSKKGDFKTAEDNYTISLQLAFKHQDSSRISSVYSYKAAMFTLKKDYPKALENYRNSLSFMTKKAAYESLMGLSHNIATTCMKLGLYKEACESFEKYKVWSDSAHNVNETKKQTELKLGFEFNQVQEKLKAEAEAKELINKTEHERDRQYRNYLLAGLALISFFLIIAIRNYIAKRKANSILEKQKTEIENQKKIVEEKNKEILDSIHYAKRIQTALLASEHYIDRNLRRLHKEK